MVAADVGEKQVEAPEPQSSGTYFLYNGGGTGAVKFEMLPGVEFEPRKPVLLTERLAPIADRIPALLPCDEKGKLVVLKPGAAVPKGGQWGRVTASGDVLEAVILAEGEALPKADKGAVPGGVGWALLDCRVKKPEEA
jgi:hypothetical protein